MSTQWRDGSIVLAAVAIALGCVSTPASATRTWVPLDGFPEGAPAELVLDEGASNSSESFFDLHIHGFWTKPRTGPDLLEYQYIEVPGLASMAQPTAPDLPVVRSRLAVPNDASSGFLSATPESVQVFPGYLPWPVYAVPEMDHEEGDPPVFGRDEGIYAGAATWPPDDGSAGSQVLVALRSIPSLKWEGHPIHWNPVTGDLTVQQHVRYQILHAGSPLTFDPMTKERGRIAARRFDNWPNVAPSFPLNTFQYEADFLLIYPVGYDDELDPFVTQKKARGFRVTEMTTATTGNTCTSIRAAIGAWYATVPLSRDAYCLLVGDTGEIPLCTSPTGVETDDLYASTNGDDLDEEIYLGRLSVDSQTDCANQVHKILSYEDSPSMLCCYDEVALWAHEEDAPEKYEEAHESVRTAAYSTPPTFSTYYGSQAGVTDSDIVNEVNGGVGTVAYRGHGSSSATATGWNQTSEYFTSTEVTALANAESRSPVVWSFACSNMALDSSDSIAEVWMEQVGAGAVSYYSATVVSATDQNHELDRQMFRAVWDDDLVTQSHAIEQAEDRMASIVSYGNAWMYLLLGDPDLQIRRRNVFPMILVKPPGVPPEPGDLTLEATDPQGMPIPGVVIGVFKPGPGGAPDEVHDNRYTDGAGQVTIPIAPATEGMLYVAVDTGFGDTLLDSIPVGATSVLATTAGAIETKLEPCTPNPFGSATTITFSVAASGPVTLDVYDVRGRLVRRLADGVLPAGVAHRRVWDGTDAQGRTVASGVYFYRLEVDRYSNTRKMVLTR